MTNGRTSDRSRIQRIRTQRARASARRREGVRQSRARETLRSKAIRRGFRSEREFLESEIRTAISEGRPVPEEDIATLPRESRQRIQEFVERQRETQRIERAKQIGEQRRKADIQASVERRQQRVALRAAPRPTTPVTPTKEPTVPTGFAGRIERAEEFERGLSLSEESFRTRLRESKIPIVSRPGKIGEVAREVTTLGRFLPQSQIAFGQRLGAAGESFVRDPRRTVGIFGEAIREVPGEVKALTKTTRGRVTLGVTAVAGVLGARTVRPRRRVTTRTEITRPPTPKETKAIQKEQKRFDRELARTTIEVTQPTPATAQVTGEVGRLTQIAFAGRVRATAVRKRPSLDVGVLLREERIVLRRKPIKKIKPVEEDIFGRITTVKAERRIPEARRTPEGTVVGETTLTRTLGLGETRIGKTTLRTQQVTKPVRPGAEEFIVAGRAFDPTRRGFGEIGALTEVKPLRKGEPQIIITERFPGTPTVFPRVATAQLFGTETIGAIARPKVTVPITGTGEFALITGGFKPTPFKAVRAKPRAPKTISPFDTRVGVRVRPTSPLGAGRLEAPSTILIDTPTRITPSPRVTKAEKAFVGQQFEFGRQVAIEGIFAQRPTIPSRVPGVRIDRAFVPTGRAFKVSPERVIPAQVRTGEISIPTRTTLDFTPSVTIDVSRVPIPTRISQVAVTPTRQLFPQITIPQTPQILIPETPSAPPPTITTTKIITELITRTPPAQPPPILVPGVLPPIDPGFPGFPPFIIPPFFGLPGGGGAGVRRRRKKRGRVIRGVQPSVLGIAFPETKFRVDKLLGGFLGFEARPISVVRGGRGLGRRLSGSVDRLLGGVGL